MTSNGSVRMKRLELKNHKAFWGEQTPELDGKNLRIS